MKLSTQPIITALDQQRDALLMLQGLELDIDGPGGTRRADVARVTRQLLSVADRLDLLSALVRQEYWATKGLSRVDAPDVADDLAAQPYL